MKRKQRGFFLINPFLTVPSGSYIVGETGGSDFVEQESSTDLIEVESYDPYYGIVQLLLHGDGAPQSPTIVDSSAAALTPAQSAGVIHSAAKPRFGLTSLVFDGSSYVSYAPSTAFNTAQGDFCYECWLYPTTNDATDRFVAGLVYSSSYEFDWWLRYSNAQVYASFSDGVGGSYTLGENVGLSASTWYHLAFFRLGGTFYLSKNGAVIGTQAAATMGHDSRSVLTVGAAPAWGGSPVVGYIDEARYTVGNGRYSSLGFTAPSLPFTNY